MGVLSGDVIIYIHYYMSAGSRGNIVQDHPAHTLLVRTVEIGEQRGRGWN